MSLSGTSGVNVAQINGVTPDIGGGNAGTGTLRVVLATDQPQTTLSLKVAGNAASGATDSGNPVKAGGVFNSTPPTFTNGQRGDLQLTANGSLKVDASATTQPVSGTVTTNPPANASTNVAQIAGTAASVNSGTKDAGTLRVTLATDQVQLTNALKVDGSAVTQPVSGTVTANAGTGNFTVVNAGTFATQDSEKIQDRATFTQGTTKVQPIGLIFDDVAGTLPAENTMAAARINVNRAQVGVIEDGTTRAQYAAVSAAGALKVDNSAVTQPVSGTVTANVGTAATDLGKAEDAAHTSGDVGVLALGVRRDADTTPVSADGDYHAPIFDNAGNLKVNIKAGAGSGGTAMTDDAAFTPGTTSITPAGGTYRTTRDSLDDNDGGAIALTQKRAVLVSLEDSTGDSAMDDTNNAVRVNVVAGSSGGPSKTDDAAFTVATDAVAPAGYMADETSPDSVDEGDVGIARMSLNRNVYVQLRDISAERSAAVSAANALKVDGSGVTQPVSGTVTANAGTGTFTVSGTVTANLSAGTNTNEVVGDVAQDAAIAGNPLGTGGRASSAVPTAMSADGDSVYTWLDRSGGTVVNGRDAHDAALDSNTNPQLVGGRASAAAPTDVSADGDAVRAWYLRNGAQATVVTAAGALIGGDATNGLDVDVTRLPALPAGTNNIGDVDVLTLPNVTLAAGTNTNEVVGDVAQDAAIAGNPLSIGGRASSAIPTAMSADGDAVYQWLDRTGATIVNGRDAHDAPLDSGSNPALIGGRASTAAPTDVSADGDSVRGWFLRSGAQVMAGPIPMDRAGLSIFRSLDLDETEEDVKTSRGQVFGWYMSNRSTAPRYVKFYNATAANVTVGTMTPVMTLELPGNSTDHIAANALGGFGIEFDTAISCAATTGVADNDTGAPGTNDVVINVFYK